MTYNLHHCEGEDGIYDVARIARFMQEHKADIVLCQEVDNGFSERSKMDAQPEMLAGMLGYHSFYGPNIGDTYGNLLLSRYPIVSAENISLPNPDNKEPRGLIAAKIDIVGSTFTFLVTHLSAFSDNNRTAQVKFLKDYLPQFGSRVVFGADFNTKPSGQLRPLLEDGGIIASRDGILGLGEGIDDILVSRDLKDSITDGAVVENKLSDHPAYWIDCKIDR